MLLLKNLWQLQEEETANYNTHATLSARPRVKVTLIYQPEVRYSGQFRQL